MKLFAVTIRKYQQVDLDALATIYYNKVHQVICKIYTQEPVDAWAPNLYMENSDEWAHQFSKTQPFVAAIGKGISSILMQAIFLKKILINDDFHIVPDFGSDCTKPNNHIACD